MPYSVQFSEYGNTDVLRVVDLPALSPDPGQVRIAVRAAGINPIDWKLRSGAAKARMPLELPAALGRDAAGEVTMVGAGVGDLKVGDESWGS